MEVIVLAVRKEGDKTKKGRTKTDRFALKKVLYFFKIPQKSILPEKIWHKH